jgi:hypothetical protein
MLVADAKRRDIRGYACAGRIGLTHHARVRCRERSISPREVVEALMHARRCVPAGGGRVRVHARNRVGERIVVIVVIEDGLVVVTVHGE